MGQIDGDGLAGLLAQALDAPAVLLAIGGVAAYFIGVLIVGNSGNGDTFSGDGDGD